MSKQMIEVDVPEGWEVDRVSPPVFNGFADDSGLICASAGYVSVSIRPAWQWPKEWLFRWAAKNRDGTIYGYSDQPSIIDGSGCWASREFVARFGQGATTFDIPGPWQDSLRENPNWKEGE